MDKNEQLGQEREEEMGGSGATKRGAADGSNRSKAGERDM